jgi:Ni,Fe-hydrogenase III component G
VAERMLATADSRLATATGIDVRDGIDVLYHWCVEPPGVVLTLKALAARPEMTLDSIAPVVPAANWIEREMHDLLGVNFRGHPDMRRLVLDDSWPEGLHPLRKDFDQVRDRPPLPPVPPAPEEGLP